MEEKKVKVEGAGKGGGRPFHHWNFKKKDSMFKSPTVGLETIVFSYGKLKDAAAFIKSNEVLSRYIGVNFKVRGPISAKAILSVTEPYLKLPEDPDDTAVKVDFLKWETDFSAISKNKLIWKENR